MRNTTNILGCLSLVFLLPLGNIACSAGGGNRSGQNELSLEISVQDLCQESIRGQFSMQAVGENLYILYPERDTLALKLLMLTPDSRQRLQPGTAYYLDRISYTPDVDAYFGEHLYRAGDDQHDIYFYDRQSESKYVLKHIQRTPEDDSWSVELVPASGRLTAALTSSEGMDLFVNQDNALMHLPAGPWPAAPGPETPAAILQEPFRAGEAARILDGTAEAGFTVYDALSGQLYRIRRLDDAYRAQPLFIGGPVHHAAQDAEGNLDILTYNPESSELVLFEESLSGEFDETAVTLCRETTSVFFFSVNGRRMFVYNETTLDRARSTLYCLSLLYPDGAGKYRKKVLYEDEQPIQRFQAAFLKDCLHVSFVQEPLRLLSVCFSAGGSVEDQDL